MPRKKRGSGPAAKKHRAFLNAHRQHYDALLELQGGGCAICGKPPETTRLDMDHNHRTMELRGLLCRHCNRFGVQDWMTAEWAEALAKYLREPPFTRLMRTLV